MSVINPRGSNVSWGAAEAGVPPAAGYKPRDNADIRNSYNDKVTSAYEDSFRARFQEFHDNEQCFGDELAREAFDARTKIKEAHQAETSLLGRVAIWFRNVFTYGAGNATYEGLSKTKNPEELAYSAFKSDGKNLGLNGNGFGETLDVWKAIKEVTTLYPEDVTPAMLAEYKAQLAANGTNTAFKPNVDAILAAGGHTADPRLAAFAESQKSTKVHA